MEQLRQSLIAPTINDDDQELQAVQREVNLEQSRAQAKADFIVWLGTQGVQTSDIEHNQEHQRDDVDNDELEEWMTLIRKQMEKQLEVDFGMDKYVARYALTKTEYRSLEEAT